MDSKLVTGVVLSFMFAILGVLLPGKGKGTLEIPSDESIAETEYQSASTADEIDDLRKRVVVVEASTGTLASQMRSVQSQIDELVARNAQKPVEKQPAVESTKTVVNAPQASGGSTGSTYAPSASYGSTGSASKSASYGSTGSSATSSYYQPQQSAPINYYQPQYETRRGLFGRSYQVRSSGTCRVVNGQVVCD